MDQTRRHLLIVGALTAASAALPFEAFGKVAMESAATPPPPTAHEYEVLATLTSDDFKPFVGRVFHTQSQTSKNVGLILAEVQSPPAGAGAMPDSAPDPRVYALRFKAQAGPTLTQDTYVFQVNGLPHFAMFIVPSAAKAKPMYYTGHVNRSV
jgi:hypothetical protein